MIEQNPLCLSAFVRDQNTMQQSRIVYIRITQRHKAHKDNILHQTKLSHKKVLM